MWVTVDVGIPLQCYKCAFIDGEFTPGSKEDPFPPSGVVMNGHCNLFSGVSIDNSMTV